MVHFVAPRAQFCEQREGGKGIRERKELKKKKNPSLWRDIPHPHLQSRMEMGIMLHLIFWWHGWNAVISYLGHNSAKLKNRRAQKHRKKKTNRDAKKKREKDKEEKCIFCCFKTIAKIWLNCALLWKGAKYSWGILFKRLRSFWTRVHATASLRVAHHYL